MAIASLVTNRDGTAVGGTGQDSGLGELTLIRNKLAKLIQARSAIGTIPPGPPTMRARFGAFLIVEVRRALFWLLPQLDSFHAAVIETARLQAGFVEELACEQRNLDVRLQGIDQQLKRARMPSVHRLDEMERGWGGMRERLREIDDSVRELEYRIKSQENRLPFELEQLRNQRPTYSARASSVPDSPAERPQVDGEPRELVIKVLREGGLGSVAMPVLDVGSKDGALLELLEAADFSAAGVEANHVLAAAAAAKGLRIVAADPIIYLSSLPSCCMGAVTALSWIDDLSFPQLITLLDETARILKPGGAAICICPLADGPSEKPWPVAMLGKVAQLRGFDRADLINMHSGSQVLIAYKSQG